ncbi:MAG TPA: argininosuccinate lyase [Acidimicrobiales bacterium]|jgi:argininosuccinate lyase|nr:argininosuccinate lyase [Acidimicrobiales bacterium]
MTLWSERMATGPAPEMMAFCVSLDVDRRLAADDVRGSIAHVRGLGRVGVLTAGEVEALAAALATVGEELATSRFSFVESDEDIHTAIERRVTELAGPTGAKVHTARSRNDQVVTATRLYLRRAIVRICEAILEVESTLLGRAQSAGLAYLPGYTHLQRAQPVALAHHLLAHGWALARDVDRLIDAHRRLNVSPLGAGALGGSTLPLDPDGVAAELGFARRFDNSIDAVSDRDFVAEVLFALALLGVHLSRIGEEIVLFSTDEFGFYHLDDAWSTGSSMLPQKKNPDIAELARGKAGRLIGDLVAILTTLKGLPLAYNRDLQEDKPPLFDAIDEIERALPAVSGLLESLHLDLDAMAKAADAPSLVAIDLAEWLVARGVPFRDAHGIVGSLVRASLDGDVPLAQLVEADPHFGPEATSLFQAASALKRRQTLGGGGEAAVNAQIGAFVAGIARDRERIDALVR